VKQQQERGLLGDNTGLALDGFDGGGHNSPVKKASWLSMSFAHTAR
jgi:hypothetical protein